MIHKVVKRKKREEIGERIGNCIKTAEKLGVVIGN
jgi:hypothetical protein